MKKICAILAVLALAGCAAQPRAPPRPPPPPPAPTVPIPPPPPKGEPDLFTGIDAARLRALAGRARLYAQGRRHRDVAL